MTVNLPQLLARFLTPLVGALLGWLTAQGLAVPAGTDGVLIAVGASLITAAWHVLEKRLSPGAGAGPVGPQVSLAVKPDDPARTPPAGGGSGGTAAKALLGALALATLAHLTGCAALGMTPAKTPAERLGYAYAGIIGALQTLQQELAAGTVTREQGQAVNQDLMAVSGELDTARQALCGADPKCATPASSPAALETLQAATAALAQVSAFLTCREVKGATCPLP